MNSRYIFPMVLAISAIAAPPLESERPPDVRNDTVALWLFDEQIGLYPSFTLNDSSPNDYPLAIGFGAEIVPGKFGNALAFEQRAAPPLPKGSVRFGLRAPEKPPGRKIEPLWWGNADFGALMTVGEKHLRAEPGYANVTETKLNLGAFDWTVEFWFRANKTPGTGGVVFEAGEGPRGENDRITRLSLAIGPHSREFALFNQPSHTTVHIPTPAITLDGNWHHLAFVYTEEDRRLRHYVDGRLQRPAPKARIEALARGAEAYFSVGRDGLWRHPLPGAIDELRISASAVYSGDFTVPGSFAEPPEHRTLRAGPPLLFAKPRKSGPVALGDRKYLFLDDALLSEQHNIQFTVNPPRLAGKVLEFTPNLTKHVNVIEDENGLIRMYYEGPDDTLAVLTSRDGVHWSKPDVGTSYNGARNVVITQKVRNTGSVFIDPNAPPDERWVFVGGFSSRGLFAYTSKDGWSFRRHTPAVLPFAAGSHSTIFYDEQRRGYMAYLRSNLDRTAGGASQRQFEWTQVENLLQPWPYTPTTLESLAEARKIRRLGNPQPWYLDNGPISPAGFGLEFPVALAPDPNLDPPGTDIYVLKAVKYEWAPDAYIAFPSVYFHYSGEAPKTRSIWSEKQRERGSGVIETQVATSRDGVHWRRYPRPVYVGLGKHDGTDLHMIYMAQGMIRRGDEIWQYYVGDGNFHSPVHLDIKKQEVYRAVQRLDGFVSADAPYSGGDLKTRTLTFTGNRLALNIDTAAAGFAQVGLLDESGHEIPGYGLDDCLYINGDFIRTEVEWMNRGKDVGELQNRPVQVVFRMRGAKLYSMQFAYRAATRAK